MGPLAIAAQLLRIGYFNTWFYVPAMLRAPYIKMIAGTVIAVIFRAWIEAHAVCILLPTCYVA